MGETLHNPKFKALAISEVFSDRFKEYMLYDKRYRIATLFGEMVAEEFNLDDFANGQTFSITIDCSDLEAYFPDRESKIAFLAGSAQVGFEAAMNCRGLPYVSAETLDAYDEVANEAVITLAAPLH